jgi:hypothetical protein
LCYGTGMAEAVPVPVPTDKERARFWAKVEKRTDGCWIWVGAKFTQGYGAFRLRGKMRRAHRVAYVWEHGELGSAYFGLDHICDNRLCVNPAHLRPALAIENVLRGGGVTAENARKQHCKFGHPLDYEDDRGWRGCTICRREASARYLERNRASVNARRSERRRSRGV